MRAPAVDGPNLGRLFVGVLLASAALSGYGCGPRQVAPQQPLRCDDFSGTFQFPDSDLQLTFEQQGCTVTRKSSRGGSQTLVPYAGGVTGTVNSEGHSYPVNYALSWQNGGKTMRIEMQVIYDDGRLSEHPTHYTLTQSGDIEMTQYHWVVPADGPDGPTSKSTQVLRRIDPAPPKGRPTD